MCQACKNAPAEEVHHIKPLNSDNILDKEIAVGEQNLISLCRDCHFKQHEKDKARGNRQRKNDIAEGFEFDKDGYPIKISQG